MYSSPVADSIERVRAVWIAAHDTTSGNTSPTTSRSHTNRAHGPVSGANGPPPEPPPSATETTKNTSWSTTTTGAGPARTARADASGSFGVTRYQWPEDHRREDAAGGRRQEQALADERQQRREAAAPAERAEDERADAGDHAGDPEPGRPTAAGQDDRVRRGDEREAEERRPAARRPRSDRSGPRPYRRRPSAGRCRTGRRAARSRRRRPT